MRDYAHHFMCEIAKGGEETVGVELSPDTTARAYHDYSCVALRMNFSAESMKVVEY